jgi:hypothetical protein
MMREVGVTVNDVPKIQLTEPCESNHAIIFPEMGFQIPLSLSGIFLYFPTTKPSHETLVGAEEVYLLTPTQWNPHCDLYALNERSMLDWEGNMKQKCDQEVRVVLEELPEYEVTVNSLSVG